MPRSVRILLGCLGAALVFWGALYWYQVLWIAYLRSQEAIIVRSSGSPWPLVVSGILSPAVGAVLLNWVRRA